MHLRLPTPEGRVNDVAATSCLQYHSYIFVLRVNAEESNVTLPCILLLPRAWSPPHACRACLISPFLTFLSLFGIQKQQWKCEGCNSFPVTCICMLSLQCWSSLGACARGAFRALLPVGFGPGTPWVCQKQCVGTNFFSCQRSIREEAQQMAGNSLVPTQCITYLEPLAGLSHQH